MTEDYDRFQKAHDRRLLVKKIIEERGFTSVIGLRNILASEYGIDVSRPTIYKDLQNIGGIDEKEFEGIGQRIIAGLRKNLRDLQEIVNNASNDKTKIVAIKAYSAGAKDLAEILRKLAVREIERPKFEKKKQSDEKTYTIKFTDDVNVAEEEEFLEE